MYIKCIDVEVIAGQMDAFRQSQAIWNDETRQSPSSIGYFIGIDPEQANHMLLVFCWTSQADYERWMAEEHDRIAEIAGADKYYVRLNITFSESSLTSPVEFWQAEMPHLSLIDVWSQTDTAERP